MNHKQILNKLASNRLVEAVEDDISLLLNYGGATDGIDNQLKLLFNRWNCALLAEEGVGKHYQNTLYIILATLFHKYGITNENITNKALIAIDKLNDDVVLSDEFYRKSSEIKSFLNTTPQIPKRNPRKPQRITFFRAKDVISLQIHNKYYVAYVHNIVGFNEVSLIEFYETVFDELPSIHQLTNLKAKGQKYNDGIVRISKFSVLGLKFQPDLANQIHLIDVNNSDVIPCNKHLGESTGVYTASDIFSIQVYMTRLFDNIELLLT